MRIAYHADLTLGALRRWLVAQLYDSAIVGALWLAALLLLKVPFAPLWAVLAAGLQFIPHFGPPLALIGPSFAMLLSSASGKTWLYFLGVFAGIFVLDGLVLQPYLMRRQNRVPFWASLLAPLALGIVFQFWGVLLAPPLLAVIYAYRGAPKPQVTPAEQKFSANDEGVILPPEDRPNPGN